MISSASGNELIREGERQLKNVIGEKNATTVISYLKGNPVRVISVLAFTVYFFTAVYYIHHVPTFRPHPKWSTRKWNKRKKICQVSDQSGNSTNKEQDNLNEEVKPSNYTRKRSHEIKIKRNEEHAHKTKSRTPDVELSFILLGATGSGKSSVGNLLLQKPKIGFKTSCYAKSQTMKTILKSVFKTMELKNVSKTYKINITDTPAIFDTGLTADEVEREIKKATTHSSDAFLLCIPATAITTYYTSDVINSDIYKKYFANGFSDSTIVVFTRCDQFEIENKRTFKIEHAIDKSKIFSQMKYIHVNGKDESKILEEVIELVEKMKTNKTDEKWYSPVLRYFKNILRGKQPENKQNK